MLTIYDYSRSRSFIDHCPRSFRFNIFKLQFQRNRQADWSQISYGICSNFPGHMTMPIYGKNTFPNPRLYYHQFFQIMTLGRPWPFLWHGQICFLLLLYRRQLIQCWVHRCDKFQKGITKIFLSFQGGLSEIYSLEKFLIKMRESLKFW